MYKLSDLCITGPRWVAFSRECEWQEALLYPVCDRPEDSSSGVSRTTGTVTTSYNDLETWSVRRPAYLARWSTLYHICVYTLLCSANYLKLTFHSFHHSYHLASDYFLWVLQPSPLFSIQNSFFFLVDALSAGEDERPGGGRGVFKTTAYIPTASTTTTTTVAATTAAAQDSGSPVATTPNGTIASRMAPRRPRVRMPMPLPGQAPEAEVKAEVETEATPEVAETTVRPPQARIRGFPRTRMLPPRPPGA